MPYRITPLVSSQVYHVYNRGVARLPVFTNKREYDRFLATISYYRYRKVPMKLSLFLELAGKQREAMLAKLATTNDVLVELLCFCLMPNHFHLLVKQVADHGLTTYLGRSCNSYCKYMNTKHRRVGPLFQGPFKVVRVESDEQLLHLSRYIHLNPLVSYVVREEDFFSYPWSSLSDYLTGSSSRVILDPIRSQFSSAEAYKTFVLDQADYGKTLERIKHVCLEGLNGP